MHPFCLDRQELDKKELGGEVTQVPKSIPVKGQPLYYDPWDYHVMEVRKLKEVKEKEEAERIAAKTYQLSLHDIPLVDYYATTKLREFRQSTASSQASQSQSAGAPDDGQAGLSRSMTGVSSMSAGGEFDGMMTAESNTRAGTAASFNESVELDSSYPYWYLLEEEMKKSYKAAKKGDRAALYEINIGRHLRSSGSNKGFNDTASMVSSVGMDSIYDMDEVQRLDDEVDGTRAQTTHADRMMMLARSDEADEEDEEQEES